MKTVLKIFLTIVLAVFYLVAFTIIREVNAQGWITDIILIAFTIGLIWLIWRKGKKITN